MRWNFESLENSYRNVCDVLWTWHEQTFIECIDKYLFYNNFFLFAEHLLVFSSVSVNAFIELVGFCEALKNNKYFNGYVPHINYFQDIFSNVINNFWKI